MRLWSSDYSRGLTVAKGAGHLIALVHQFRSKLKIDKLRFAIHTKHHDRHHKARIKRPPRPSGNSAQNIWHVKLCLQDLANLEDKDSSDHDGHLAEQKLFGSNPGKIPVLSKMR